MNRFIKCCDCNKIAMELTEGSKVAKGTKVRCVHCEKKLQKRIQALNYSSSVNSPKRGLYDGGLYSDGLFSNIFKN